MSGYVLTPLAKADIFRIWAYLRLSPSLATAAYVSAAFPFVIPTEAKRSGGICSSLSPPTTLLK
jgi:hypothetical protein